MQSTLVAVDLAKNVFEIAVSQQPGRVAERHRLARSKFLEFVAERQPEVVLLEATGSAHHWGRKLQQLGHQPVLLPPRAVKRYRDGNKTDRTDAKSLLEASRNEEIRPVPLKTVAQQILTSLHRLRSAWMATRTARINTVRGLLRELGLTIPLGARRVTPVVIGLLADPESAIPLPLRAVLGETCEEIHQLEARIRTVERQLEALARRSPPSIICERSRASACSQQPRSTLSSAMPDVSQRETLRQLPRSDSQGTLQRQRPTTGTDLQAWRHLSTHATDSRCSSRFASGPGSHFAHAIALLGARRAATSWSQRRRYRARQQARTDRLGGVASGTLLQPGLTPAQIPPTTAERTIDEMAMQVRPARGRADNKRGPQRPLAAIGCLARLSILARSVELHHSGRKHDCSRVLPA